MFSTDEIAFEFEMVFHFVVQAGVETPVQVINLPQLPD
jgi:hypothetical protein